MNPNKVLFLDFDGVLNSTSTILDRGSANIIDIDMVKRVARIIEATGCCIVISSTWRLYHTMPELKALLSQHGMPDVVIDKTPELTRDNHNRGDEIRSWLDANPHVKYFVILDDYSDMSSVIDHLVQTSFKTGMQDEHVVKAITILQKD